jgi:NAD(P)H-hydrate epimerase
MKCRPLTREEVRRLDQQAVLEFGLPGIALMENAGRAAAAHLVSLGASGRVLICAGKGNNGGDGFVMARHLDAWGVEVKVLLFCEPVLLEGDAAINFQVIARSGIGWQALADPRSDCLRQELHAAEWVVDALLGTGLAGPVRSPLADVISAINAAQRPVLAVDLPSGLDANTGQPLGACVVAAHTVTFVAPKVGFAAPAASEKTGAVHVVEIGLPRRLLEPYSLDAAS